MSSASVSEAGIVITRNASPPLPRPPRFVSVRMFRRPFSHLVQQGVQHSLLRSLNIQTPPVPMLYCLFSSHLFFALILVLPFFTADYKPS